MGNQLARWFAVAVVGINAIEMTFFIPAYPFWALVIIAADVAALWGLGAYGSRENLEAVSAPQCPDRSRPEHAPPCEETGKRGPRPGEQRWILFRTPPGGRRLSQSCRGLWLTGRSRVDIVSACAQPETAHAGDLRHRACRQESGSRKRVVS